MKIRNLFVMLLLGGSLIFSGSVFTGCASWSNTGKGAATVSYTHLTLPTIA